jgi:hypothetical protein
MKSGARNTRRHCAPATHVQRCSTVVAQVAPAPVRSFEAAAGAALSTTVAVPQVGGLDEHARPTLADARRANRLPAPARRGLKQPQVGADACPLAARSKMRATMQKRIGTFSPYHGDQLLRRA